MSVIGALLRRPPEARAIRDEDVWGAWASGDGIPGRLYSPVRVTRETAQALSAVWACRALIAGTIATLPWDVFTRRDGGRFRFRPRPAWVGQPNAEQTRAQLVEQIVESMLFDGTAFVYTPRDERGFVREVWCVDPRRVDIRRTDEGLRYDVRTDSGVVTLRGGLMGEMFHIPAYAPPGGLRGMPPLEVARTMIGAGLAAQEFAARFYRQGMTATGIIEVPQGAEVDSRQLREDFRAIYGGARNAYLPAVLTGGAQWKPLSITPEQAQFIEARQLTKEDIATFFLVPPHLISKVDRTTSWGSGIEEQNIAFVTYTLRQWIARIELAFTTWALADLPGVFLRIIVDGLLRGNTEARYRAYAIGRQWGWLSADDVRLLEDMPPLPDGQGQTYLTPLNMAPANVAPSDQGGSTDGSS